MKSPPRDDEGGRQAERSFFLRAAKDTYICCTCEIRTYVLNYYNIRIQIDINCYFIYFLPPFIAAVGPDTGKSLFYILIHIILLHTSTCDTPAVDTNCVSAVDVKIFRYLDHTRISTLYRRQGQRRRRRYGTKKRRSTNVERCYANSQEILSRARASFNHGIRHNSL